MLMRAGMNRSYRPAVHIVPNYPFNQVSLPAPKVHTQLLCKPLRSVLQLLLSRPCNAHNGPFPALAQHHEPYIPR